jgi:hypothetical protein
MKEYKVGQIVTIKGTKTRVTNAPSTLFSCKECIFGGNGCEDYECRGSHRYDSNWVIFKPIPIPKASNKQSGVVIPKDENNALGASNQSEFPLPPENMRVWIRGNKERGKEVIKALTDLGAVNTDNYYGYYITALYYITNLNTIDWAAIGSNTAALIANFYKEIKLPWKPKDKELVWCWDDDYPFSRYLAFYDAKNNRVFRSGDGSRLGVKFSHYAPYEGEWPEWAKEAVKKLED